MEYQFDEVTLRCPKCYETAKGHLLPLQDVFSGSDAFLKGFACSNPDCTNAFKNQGGILVRWVIGNEPERNR